jgi:hypothetical protein
MSFSLKVDRKNRRIETQIKNTPHLTRRGIRAAFFRLGNDLVEEARKSILQGPKTGKIRRIKRKRHQSSAPGEAPANLSGLLKRSIAYQQRGGDQMVFGARTDYAPFLELPDVLNRPFLITSIDKNKRNARDHFEREIESELKRGVGR